MNIVELFKNDLWSGFWSHGRRLVKTLIPINLIGLLLTIFLLFGAVFLMGSIFEGIELRENMTSEEIFELIEDIAYTIDEHQTEFMLKSLVIGLMFGVFGAWYYNISFRLSEQLVMGQPTNFGQAMTDAFGRSFIQMLILSIILSLLSGVVSAVVEGVDAVAPGITLLINIILQVVVLRFFVARSAVVHGNLSFSEALRFSWDNVTFIRALKIFLIIVVAVVLLALLYFGMIVSFANSGSVGVVMLLLILIFSAHAGMCFMISAQTAGYYRYADVEEDLGQSETDHLIEE